jgi:hypothetical protein
VLSSGLRWAYEAARVHIAAWRRGGSVGRFRQMRRATACVGQSDAEGQSRIKAFLEGLQALGWIEGRNLQIEYRWGDGSTDRIRTYAAELVRLALRSLSGIQHLSLTRDVTSEACAPPPGPRATVQRGPNISRGM